LHLRRTRVAAVAAIALSAAAITASSAAAASTPPPLDPQNWSWQDNLGWADYKALPGPDYSDPSIQPTVKKWKVALVVTDFPDKPFTISQGADATVFGTPTTEANGIPRAQVPAFYRDFLNKPQALNHYQTMNRYWMEDSFGKYGVQLDAYGPYQMPGRSYQYFEQGYDSRGIACPTKTVTPCNKNFRTDARAAWVADVGATVAGSYDNIFYVSAGEDQTSTWQEFGEMKFADQDSIPDAFGPKAFDSTLPNWAPTRYVPWTSWASASTIWPNASGNTSIEAESSGMATYAHELTHNLGLPDNYNNPYGTTQQTTATGMWDMMSRGSFNGPGGPHTRYLIPPTQGAALGSQHNMRNKVKLGFLTNDDVVRLNRGGLAQSGLAVADVTAREVAPSASEISGLDVTLDGGDKEPTCTVASDPSCDGGKFNHYTMEVVQQIGSDSFDPGHGVLISKTKDANSSCGSFSCFVWVVDSHPGDIDHVDFVLPNGQPKMATIGDERQKNDASFNAGTNSGSLAEYEDTANRLHFYVLDTSTDAQGVLHYKVGVRSLDGAGPQTRGVKLGTPVSGSDGGFATCSFPLTNSGTAAATPDVHPQDAAAYLGSDIYRLKVSASGEGWSAALRNEFATAKFGQTVQVPVYVTKGAGAGSVTLTATSESDPSTTTSTTCATGTVGGTVAPTLSLTLNGDASFGSFAPGLAQVYDATTTASVTSTAGDATLTVADPSTTAPGHLVNGSFSLSQPLKVGGSALPATVKTYAAPATNDAVTVAFSQAVGSTDALRTGTYSKTLTFTLSTTQP